MNLQQKRAIKQLLEIRKYGKNMRLAAEEWESQWQTLIAIVLSARTRDEVTIKVCKRLFINYKSLEELALARIDDVSQVIKSINFYKNKSKNIVNCSKSILARFNGFVPHDIDLLVSLPGVGRKTANVFLSEYNHNTIGVDTHVAYISQKLKWAKNSNPNNIERELKALFPEKYWSKINLYLVRFGKTYNSRKQKNIILNDIMKIK